MLMAGRPADIKQDASLPLNAQLFQTTLGVTSEGFQASPLIYFCSTALGGGLGLGRAA